MPQNALDYFKSQGMDQLFTTPEDLRLYVNAFFQQSLSNHKFAQYCSLFERELMDKLKKLIQFYKSNTTSLGALYDLAKYVKKIEDQSILVHEHHRKKPRERITGFHAINQTYVNPSSYTTGGYMGFQIFIVHGDNFATQEVGAFSKSEIIQGKGKKAAINLLNERKKEVVAGIHRDVDPTKNQFGFQKDENKHAEDEWFINHYGDLKATLTSLANSPIHHLEILDSASPCQRCRENYFLPLYNYLKVHHQSIPMYVYTFRDDQTQQGSNTNLSQQQLKQAIWLIEEGGAIRRIGVWSDGQQPIKDNYEVSL